MHSVFNYRPYNALVVNAHSSTYKVITFSSLSRGGGALLQLQENTPHSRHILGMTGGLGTEVAMCAHSLPFLSRGNSIQLRNSSGSFLFLVCFSRLCKLLLILRVPVCKLLCSLHPQLLLLLLLICIFLLEHL